jgi:large subunit ribosomal protein L3
MKAIIGKKLGMTQIVNDLGQLVPVTLIEAAPCTVTQIKTADKDGYMAIQIGYGETKKLNKAQQGHLKQAAVSSSKLKEVRLESDSEFQIGDKISIENFTEGDVVKVTAISKGKGFAGTIKRHNFSRGPVSHGSHNIRQPGSIGSMYPQKVFKGKKMAGRMGAEQVTTRGLKVAYIDSAKNIIGIKGAVPGPNKGLVTIDGRNVNSKGGAN